MTEVELERALRSGRLEADNVGNGRWFGLQA